MMKMSLGVIRKDKELLLFPLISGLLTFLILAGFIVGMFFDAAGWFMFVGMCVLYFGAVFVTSFFNAAIIGCATIRLNGGDPTFADGIRIAKENARRIFVWTLIAATVGVIIGALQQKAGIGGRIALGIAGAAWTVASYFVIPVLIYEKVGPWEALKRSASVFKDTWGESIVGNIGLGAIFVLLGLAGVLLPVLGFVLAGVTGLIVGAIIMVAYVAVIAIIGSAAQAVLVAALYRYATTGKDSEDFQDLSFGDPWSS
jgi:hypothetical protein